MSTRQIYLIIYSGQTGQRAHFAIQVPNEDNGTEGTLIHVVGHPMAGFSLEFKRQYDVAETKRKIQTIPIGRVLVQHLHNYAGDACKETTARGQLERVATQVQPPRASANFLEPVNDTTNRRCQEWTMDFVRRLVTLGYIDEAAIGIVQAKRDPPELGIRLRPASARQQLPQTTATGNEWQWDVTHQRYRRWDGQQWIWQ